MVFFYNHTNFQWTILVKCAECPKFDSLHYHLTNCSSYKSFSFKETNLVLTFSLYYKMFSGLSDSCQCSQIFDTVKMTCVKPRNRILFTGKTPKQPSYRVSRTCPVVAEMSTLFAGPTNKNRTSL